MAANRYGLILVQDNQCCNDSGNPADAGKDEYDEDRTATAVEYGQRREDDG